MSQFDEWKGRFDSAMGRLDEECDVVLERAKGWKERLQKVSHGLGMCIGKSWGGEKLKSSVGGYMSERSKVGEEMVEVVRRVQKVLDEICEVGQDSEVMIASGTNDERRWIAKGLSDLFVTKVKSASDEVQWLKGYATGLMDFMTFWAKEMDEMEELVEWWEELKGEEDSWSDVESVGGRDDWKVMFG